MFSNSIFPKLMEKWDKSVAVPVAAVFETGEHVTVEGCSKTGAYGP